MMFHLQFISPLIRLGNQRNSPCGVIKPRRWNGTADQDRIAMNCSLSLPVSELSALIRAKEISSLELTRLYLSRLKQYDPVLNCVVNLTEELALKQAQHADKEIAAGRYRGALHGIPWGAKDLIAYPGYPTTWGRDSLEGAAVRS